MSKNNQRNPLSERSLANALSEKDRGRRRGLATLADCGIPVTQRNDMLPQLEFVERSPAALRFPKRNVRKLGPAHLQEVVNAIRQFGFCVPPLIDQGDCLLDGVVRVEAAKRLGLTAIRCIRVSHLNANELRLVRLALNRLGEKGSWDISELKAELSDLIASGVAIESSGFTMAEIDHIILDDDVDPAEPAALAPAPSEAPISQVGDVFRLGGHRIECGDATKPEVYKRLMKGKKARLVLTDEPYNVPISGHVTRGSSPEFVMASGEMTEVQFAAFNDAWIAAATRSLCDGGLFGTFIDWRGYPVVHAAATKRGLTQINLVVWTKTNAGMGSLYRSQHELLPIYKKGTADHLNNIKLGKNGRWRANVWSYPGASSIGSDSREGLQDHPTVKPVAMLQDSLMDVTNRGDLVLDPFLGSGSTLIAAERSGRICRGIELDPRYVDVILRRFEATFRQSAILDSTGETFEQLAARRAAETTKRE